MEGAILLPKELPAGRRASQILHHRGIDGLLVSSHADFWSETAFAEFEWERFSLVKINRGLEDLPCHLVRHSPFDYTMKALGSMVEHGYGRVGAIMMTRTASMVDDDARVGALHAFRERRMPEDGHLAPLYVERPPMPSATEIRRWIRREKLEALLVYHSWMVRDLLLDGMRFPDEIPLAVIVRAELGMESVPLAGCDAKGNERIERGLTILLELIGRGEKGFPLNPMESVLEPAWIDGESLPRRE